MSSYEGLSERVDSFDEKLAEIPIEDKLVDLNRGMILYWRIWQNHLVYLLFYLKLRIVTCMLVSWSHKKTLKIDLLELHGKEPQVPHGQYSECEWVL